MEAHRNSGQTGGPKLQAQDPQGSLKMLTFPGHVWHFRSGVDQSSALLYVQAAAKTWRATL